MSSNHSRPVYIIDMGYKLSILKTLRRKHVHAAKRKTSVNHTLHTGNIKLTVLSLEFPVKTNVRFLNLDEDK